MAAAPMGITQFAIGSGADHTAAAAAAGAAAASTLQSNKANANNATSSSQILSKLKAQLAAQTPNPIGRSKECKAIAALLQMLAIADVQSTAFAANGFAASPSSASTGGLASAATSGSATGEITNPSILLYGPPSAGKHTCLYKALADIKFPPSNIIEIAKHERFDEATLVRHFKSRLPNKHDTLISFQQPLIDAKQPIVLILPEIEEWARHAPALLYTISEWMQPASGIRMALVMLTERADAYESFSKQLRSRLSCQTIVVSGHVSASDCIWILNTRLVLPITSSGLSTLGGTTQDPTSQLWNQLIVKWLSCRSLLQHVERWALQGRSIPHLLQVASTFIEAIVLETTFHEANWNAYWTKCLEQATATCNSTQPNAQPTQWQSFVIASFFAARKLWPKVTPLMMVSHLHKYYKETKSQSQIVGSVPKNLLTENNFLLMVQEAINFGWLDIDEKKTKRTATWTTELAATPHCPTVSLPYNDWISSGPFVPIDF